MLMALRHAVQQQDDEVIIANSSTVLTSQSWGERPGHPRNTTPEKLQYKEAIVFWDPSHVGTEKS